MDKQVEIIELHLIGFPILTSSIARVLTLWIWRSHGKLTISTYPKSGNGEEAVLWHSSSPKANACARQQQSKGSFRCRLHRSSRSSAAPMMKRSNSIGHQRRSSFPFSQVS
ncbi:hypothetical protein D5086_032005 [Populus alba]|uniref:Uncharacterized protein n=2 Tax=Populus alba TaxID=43335 RepID=A0ACC4AK73_POPAL|nr:hypothetical protein D5086_0000072390 [Populus alba]